MPMLGLGLGLGSTSCLGRKQGPPRLRQRRRMAGAAPRSGQPRRISLLGRAGRPAISGVFST
eukprot:scaffold7763_cov46-Phaeocystis_antarctica.AAC.1